MTQPPPLPENFRRPPPLPIITPPPPLPAYNPYSAPLAQVEQAPDEDLELADRGARLGAMLLDNLIVFGVVFLIVPLGAALEKVSQAASSFAILLMGAALLAVLVINLVLLHRQGQTLGKRIVGIRILRIDGSRCELWRIIVLRVFAIGLLQMIPFIGWIIFLIDALMIFGEERRCLHDMFADTMVVKA